MMFYLSKVLPVLGLPLGVVLMLMVAASIWRMRWALVAALGLLYVTSLPFTGRLLLGRLERGMERVPASAKVNADAIVVLSEGRTLAPGKAKISEWNDADRFFGGIELFKAGKAPLLVFTGGAAPWEPTAPMEGTVLVNYAQQWGVPASALLTTGRVVNTAGEARAVYALLCPHAQAKEAEQKATILLVTSAYHIPRARIEFEKAGFSVEPFPVDFLVPSERVFDFTDLLPSPKGIGDTTLALRETYGRLVARLF